MKICRSIHVDVNGIILLFLQLSNIPLGASLIAQLVKNLPAMQDTLVQILGWEDPLEKKWLPTPVFWPGEFLGLYSPWVAKSWTWLSEFHLPRSSRNSGPPPRSSLNSKKQTGRYHLRYIIWFISKINWKKNKLRYLSFLLCIFCKLDKGVYYHLKSHPRSHSKWVKNVMNLN